MRILQVIEFFSPSMGGSAQVAYQMSRHLAARGHQVTVVASDFSADGSRFPDENFETLLFPCAFARWGFYVTPDLVGWARRHLAGYDIVHLHNVRTFQNALVGGLARRRGVPYVLSAHGSLPVIIQRQMAKRIYDRLSGRALLSSASRLVAVSPAEVKQYRDAGIEPERIRVIYNGLDLDEFASLPTSGSFRSRFQLLDPETNIVLYLGRLHQRKGINHLVEAFDRLRMQESRSILVIVGPDDGELESLRSLVACLGLQHHVLFTGPLYAQDKLAALMDADVLASPAVHEIFGLVPFEALMCGTPVVVTSDCGSGQLIEEAGAGYLVPYGDIPALKEALLEALTDPERATRKVEAGRSFVSKQLRWEVIVTELERTYSELVTEEGR